jgi:hypothetical protein
MCRVNEVRPQSAVADLRIPRHGRHRRGRAESAALGQPAGGDTVGARRYRRGGAGTLAGAVAFLTSRWTATAIVVSRRSTSGRRRTSCSGRLLSLSANDAIRLAVMKRRRLARILSFDRGFPYVPRDRASSRAKRLRRVEEATPAGRILPPILLAAAASSMPCTRVDRHRETRPA